ncbi:outer membrane protein assembly factor BamB family protein [Persicitalea jodogahamensis]|uniref:Pyrrolo-quinoline quinone repeat domain-containing protein n=1 Tax=Persicitalea jodogahamensis TaxID=402147 RepID=A0A8J3D7U1_9BACT|nr:PQQ-binding-like beta-propeller repeat protein [Persicitalea jodogahamensis]GHB58550.1 hypothetical protein GCM10007390_10040 [Persicitalea jodogahamensis]
MKEVIAFFLLVSVLSCKGPDDDVLKDENGVVTRLPHLWKSSTSLDGGRVSGMQAQHTYNGQYVLAAQRPPQPDQGRLANSLVLKSLEDGKDSWVWNDRFDQTEVDYTANYHVYAYQNLLLYKNASRFYCINQKTGQTVWRKKGGGNFGGSIGLAGIGPHYYFPGTSPELYAKNRWEESIYQGDMATGEVREVAKLKTFPDSVWHDPSGFEWIARGRSIKPFVRGSDTLLLVSYDLPVSRPYYQNTATTGYMSLYNLTQRKWVYERMPMLSEVRTGEKSEVGVGNWPNIINDKVYFAVGMWVGCYELMTGKRVWFLRVTPSSLFSDMIVAEGKLLANGQNAKLYAIDPETGSVPWVQRSSGFSSALHYQDGVVYYIETKLLIATRVSDGKVLWALECPDAYTENRTDSWITGFVTGIPGKNGKKGRIFVSTNLNVYCFEAAQ